MEPLHVNGPGAQPGRGSGTAVVTGASGGIGAVYADRLARRGHDLVLVARQADRLDLVARGIRAATGRSVETLAADLTVAADLGILEQRLLEDDRIALLVNNAGLGSVKPIVDCEAEQIDRLVALNVLAPARLARAVAPGFVARGRGAIINIASVVAVAPERMNGTYGGTKAFVLAFTQSLHHELQPHGVRVQVVLPGATRTGFWDAAGVPLSRLPDEIVMSADDCVDAALRGFDQGEVVTLPCLPHASDWDQFEAARKALAPNLSWAAVAARYTAPEPDAIGA